MMQFWGIEVKNGSTLKVQPGEDKVVHLSQACLGDVKKDKENEFIRLFVQKSGQKFVIGMLSLEKFPHVNLDLIFEDDFELSHDWKHGSVHFAGYKADNLDSMPDEDESDDDDLEELVPIDALNNGTSESKESKASSDKTSAGAKSVNSEGKPKVRIVEPPKAAKKSKDEDDTDEGEDESGEDEDGEEEVEEMADESASDDDDDDDDSDEEESDEDTPKKPETSKKRPLESASTPSVTTDKKAKFSTPQKKAADGKKVSDHVATPHPAKQAGKTPAIAEKPNKQTSKSGGSFPCSSCDRTFGSEQAVQSHSKAKHGAK